MINIDKVEKLTPIQEGMLYHSLIDDNAEGIYIEQFLLEISGDLHVETFKKCWGDLVSNCEVLRTVFIHEDVDQPLKMVLSERSIPVLFEDLTGTSSEKQKEIIDYHRTVQHWEPFKLDIGPLIRATIFQLNPSEFRVLWSYHHVLMDGYSFFQLLRQLFRSYEKVVRQNGQLHVTTVSDETYMEWLADRDWDHASDFWQDYLQDYEINHTLPSKKGVSTNGRTVKEISFSFGDEATKGLHNIGRHARATVNSVIQALWGVLLQRYYNSEDVVFGLVSSLRNAEVRDVENAVGLMINTLPVRIRFSDEMTFMDLVRNIQNNALRASEHAFFPLYQIQANSSIKQDLINHILIFTSDADISRKMCDNINEQLTDLKLLHLSYFAQTHYPLQLEFVTSDSDILLRITYDSETYDTDFINSISMHLNKVICGILSHPERKIFEIDILTGDELTQLLEDFQPHPVSSINWNSVIEMFDACVREYAERPALVFENTTLSYRQLDERANQLAGVLLKRVKAQDTIGSYMERSERFIVAALGLMKAGCCYLPLDVNAPKERNQFILNDSNVRMLIVDKGLSYEELGGTALPNMEVLEFENIDTDNINIEQVTVTYSLKPNDFAYTIYTSGTTGKPKGVKIQHQSILHLIAGLKSEIYRATEGALRVAQLAPFFFDQSIEEIFGSLLLGHTLYIASDDVRSDIGNMLPFMEKHKIELMNGTPSYIRALFSNKQYRASDSSLKRLLIGGETVPYQLIKDLAGLFDMTQVEIYNVYGPTECCVDATYYKVDVSMIDQLGCVPIGKAMIQKRAYIIDRQHRLQPVGVPGELIICGEGLAWGYVNQPELTRTKFMPDPFNEGWVAYRTGDQARWLPDGEIEYLGRIDQLIKLHGYRIELVEIEECLLSNPRVQDAAVILKEDEGRKYLCAFVVCKETDESSENELKEWLGTSLPQYMIPASIIFLEDLPVSSTGKIDRKVLSERNVRRAEKEASLIEIEMIRLWEEVLGIEGIRSTDSFFEIGGHSLYATMLLAKVQREFHVKLSVKQLFLNPTVAEFSHIVMKNKGTAEFIPVSHSEERNHYPLTSSQAQLHLIHELNPESTRYNITGHFRIHDQLSVGKVTDCFSELVRHHEILRTSFIELEGQPEPVQKIHSNVELPIHVWDREPSQHELVRPFDLMQAPLLRVSVYPLSEKCFDVYVDMHHIICDGVSNAILIQQFVDLYFYNTKPKPTLQYKDYTLWQQKYLSSDYCKESGEYWASRLGGELSELQLPPDYARKKNTGAEAGTEWLELDTDISSKIRQFAKQHNSTLFAVMLAAYNMLLYKYTGQEDVILGTTVSGRTHDDVNQSMGLFVNTIVLRNYPSGDKSINSFITEVTENVLNDLEHQEFPFDVLLNRLDVRRDSSRNPIFDIMFVMQNQVDYKQMLDHTAKVTELNVESSQAKFDLLIEIIEQDGKLIIKLEYNKNLYCKESMNRHGQYYENMIRRMVEDPEQAIASISVLVPEQSEQLVRMLDHSGAYSPRNVTIHKLFEEQVKRDPEQIAVIDKGHRYTYNELNQSANRLAHYLRQRGVGSESVVAVYMESSLQAIISILAVLKAGAGYLPVDHEFPAERVEFILRDSGATVVLTDNANRINEIESSCYIFIMSENLELLSKEPHTNPDCDTKPDDLAYIIYTSGTTGRPKGVMIQHSNVVGLIENLNSSYRFEQREVWTLFHSLSFDYSVWEIFGSLLGGATLVIVPKSIAHDPEAFIKLMETSRVTVLNQTPASFYVISSIIEKMKPDLALRYVVLAAEALHPHKLQQFHHLYPHVRLINSYGITETTVFTTFKELSKSDIDNDVRSIGKPISNISLYVMDQNNQLCPWGGIGELYVGGLGVAKGYINRNDLNAQKFIANPFDRSTKLYRSGDLVRIMNNGEIEYIGRIDHQVKIRGYRIELAEIEHVMMSHPEIHECVVLPIGDYPNNYLCAYYVAKKKFTKQELKLSLSNVLPMYCVPSKFIYLTGLPLTVNGKVDRRKLIRLAQTNNDVHIIAPRNQLEAELVTIWCELLGIEAICIEDDFFGIGGNSLLAAQLASILTQTFHKKITIRDVFLNPTIAMISGHIQMVESKGEENEFRVYAEQKDYPLALQQNRIFLISQNPDVGISYNITGKMDIYGYLESVTLENALVQLVQRHDVLRMAFAYKDGQPVQILTDNLPTITWIDKSNEDINHISEKFIRPFDVHEAPLCHIGIIQQNENHHILLFNMHHLVSDGQSMMILKKELLALLQGNKLLKSEYQYKDFVLWQRDYYQNSKKIEDEAYWLQEFKGYTPSSGLITDYSRSNVSTFEGASLCISLPESTFSALKKLAKDNQTTTFSIMLAIYKILLSKITGDCDLCVGIPVSGRTNQQLSDMVGMFVNTIALRSYCNPNGKFEEYLNQLSKNLIGALSHQHYPFEELVEKLNQPINRGEALLFQTMFTFDQNEDIQSEENGIRAVIDSSFHDASSQFDMSCTIIEHAKECTVHMEYDKNLFDSDTIIKILGYYQAIAQSVIGTPDMRIEEIELGQKRNSPQAIEWNELDFK